MQGVSRDVSCHPLDIFIPAECVPVQKLFCTRYADPVEAAASACRTVGLESCIYFCRLESAYLSNGKAGKVDRNLVSGERNVARDGLCGRARRSPVSVFLGRSRRTAGQHRYHNRTQQFVLLHVSSMTFGSALEQLPGLPLLKAFAPVNLT